MLLAAVLTPLVVVAAIAAVPLLLPAEFLVGVALALAIGIAIARHEPRRATGRAVTASEAPELHAMLDRLCVVADVRKPELVLEREAHPNSWVIDAPGRPPRLHLTQALIDLLEPHELQAVMAHELSHLANRDAAVMTVVAMPGVALLAGGARAARTGWWPLQLGAVIALVIGLLSRVGSSALSRYRELAADRGACAITGRPAALSSALLKVSGRIDGVPRADLRAIVARDAFHLVAVGRPRSCRRGRVPAPVQRLAETHPSLSRRLAALDALEQQLHR
jgi:heat shock protein HtpX